MYSIAIVDDAEQDMLRLKQFLRRYGEERGIELSAAWYASAEAFLADYRGQYDLVFMDIRMGGMDGMQAARQLRQIDGTVLLIFLTSLAQYAVQGYEVDALDYILKPVSYPALELKLHRAFARCQRESAEIVISAGAEKRRISEADLKWVEVFEHHLQYRTTQGAINAYGTLKDVEKSLPSASFMRINNQTVVNLRFVERVNGNSAWIGERVFDITRTRKKDFLAAFHRRMSSII